MKAKEGVIERLNNILTIELTAINQYFIHAEMANNWGFPGVGKLFRSNSMAEMEDAQHLIRHILYLEGLPNLQRLNQVQVGESIREDLELTWRLKRTQWTCWQRPSALQRRGRLHHSQHTGGMIREEEEHIDTLETQLEIINAIGVELYLNQQIHAEE